MVINLSAIIINYNNEIYIEQCINSVLNQTLQRIEIIIVDDGSIDLSGEIAKGYEEKYSNIKLFSQSNSGPGSARNKGLLEASGEYVIFLDSDDYLEKDVLKSLYRKAKSQDADTLIANIRCFSDQKQWYMANFNSIFKNNDIEIRHIKNNPELHLTPSASNKLYKRMFLLNRSISFDSQLRVGEDLLFTQKALHLSNKTIVKNSVMLNYRVREGTLSKDFSVAYFQGLVELQSKIRQLYKDLSLEEHLKLIEARQLKFFADSIFKKIQKMSDLELIGKSCTQFLACINNLEIIKEMDERYILFYKACSHPNKKVINQYLQFLLEKRNEEAYVINGNKIYSSFCLYYPETADDFQMNQIQLKQKIEVLKLRKTTLTIGGFAYLEQLNSSSSYKELVFKDEKKEKIYPLNNSLRTDVTYLFSNNKINYDLSGFETVDINLKSLLGLGQFDVFIRIKQDGLLIEEKLEIPLAHLKNNTKPSFAGSHTIQAIYKKSKYLSVRIEKLTVKSKIKIAMAQLKKNVRYDLSFLKQRDYHTFLAIVIYKMFGDFLRRKNIWLIGERRDTAQDNSFHLFKFIRNEYPKKQAYYVIDFTSKDYRTVKGFGNVIKFGSIKHTIYLLIAQKTINSYLETANMYTESYKKIIKYYPEWRLNDKIFLQHGVIGVSRVNHALHKNKMDYAKFVVSSAEEKQHIIEEFGYSQEEVIQTGLARWDALEDVSEGKDILLMPTWRKWIDSEEQLIQSSYYRTYVSFLSDSRLHHMLEEYDYRLKFFPHYKTQKFIKDFPFLHERIRFVRQDEETVQHLLKSHALLITDYSSVSEDFKRMKKNIIYYSFDQEAFFSKHYNQGLKKTLDREYEIQVKNQDELIKALQLSISSLSNGRTRTNPVKTSNHCQLIYDEINIDTEKK